MTCLRKNRPGWPPRGGNAGAREAARSGQAGEPSRQGNPGAEASREALGGVRAGRRWGSRGRGTRPHGPW